MPTSETRPAGRVRRRRTILVVMCLSVLVILGVAVVRLFVRPDLPPLPARVDAIIELGGPGQRDAVALALAGERRAPVLIQSTTETEAASGRCLPPVPEVRIGCFHAQPNTTRGEAEYIGRAAAEGGWKSIILVTTPDHAWRARLEVRRCFGGEVYVVTSQLPRLLWFRQIPYQAAATVKAMTFSRTC